MRTTGLPKPLAQASIESRRISPTVSASTGLETPRAITGGSPRQPPRRRSPTDREITGAPISDPVAAAVQTSPRLTPRPAWDQHHRVAQVDPPDGATRIKAPPVSGLGRKGHLTSIADTRLGE